MNYEAALISLRQMTDAVRTERVNLESHPIPERGSADDARLSRKIETWQGHARGIANAFSQRAEFAQAVASTRGPGAYGRRQSAAAHQRNNASIRALCTTFTQELAALSQRLRGPQHEGVQSLRDLSSVLEEIIELGGEELDPIARDLSRMSGDVQTSQVVAGGSPPPSALKDAGVTSPLGIMLLGMVVLAGIRVHLSAAGP